MEENTNKVLQDGGMNNKPRPETRPQKTEALLLAEERDVTHITKTIEKSSKTLGNIVRDNTQVCDWKMAGNFRK